MGWVMRLRRYLRYRAGVTMGLSAAAMSGIWLDRDAAAELAEHERRQAGIYRHR